MSDYRYKDGQKEIKLYLLDGTEVSVDMVVMDDGMYYGIPNATARLPDGRVFKFCLHNIECAEMAAPEAGDE